MGLFVAGQNAVETHAYDIQIADGTTPQDMGFGYGPGAVVLFRAHVMNADSIDHNVILWMHQGSNNYPIGFAALAAATPENPSFQDIIAGLAAPNNSGLPINTLNEFPWISVAEAVTVDGSVRALVAVAI